MQSEKGINLSGTQHQISNNDYIQTSAVPKKQIPGLIKVLSEKIQEKKNFQEDKKPPSVRGTLVNPIKQKSSQTQYCQICVRVLFPTPNFFIADCQHRYSYCLTCMYQYAIHRIRQFQEVTCPYPDCDKLLSTTDQFFKKLSADFQKKYLKINNFYRTIKDPNAKMCPAQNCEGVIRMSQLSLPIMICDTCKNVFCNKCLMKEHIGGCDQQQINYLQQNLHYRSCNQCNFVIQKKQGCNHMTCRCGYQFCYVCGQKWQQAHKCLLEENGNVILAQRVQNNRIKAQDEESSQGFYCQILLVILRILLIIPKTVVSMIIILVTILYVSASFSILCLWSGLQLVIYLSLYCLYHFCVRFCDCCLKCRQYKQINRSCLQCEANYNYLRGFNIICDKNFQIINFLSRQFPKIWQ